MYGVYVVKIQVKLSKDQVLKCVLLVENKVRKSSFLVEVCSLSQEQGKEEFLLDLFPSCSEKLDFEEKEILELNRVG